MSAESTSSAASGEKAWHKAVAGVFAAVIAPVLVAFGVKISDKVLTPAAKPEAEKPVAAATAPVTPGAAATSPAATAVVVAPPGGAAVPVVAAPVAAPAAAAATAAMPAATAPASAARAANAQAKVATVAVSSSMPVSAAAAAGETPLPHFKKPQSPVQRLFNGRDLTGFYTYLGRPQAKSKPHGKNFDPEKVFTVENGELHVSGKVNGVLQTVNEYEDYWLSVEYKWGEQTWGSHPDDARQSAVLLHIQGDDGAIRGAYPHSIHAQLIEGATGEFIVASGTGEQHVSLTAAVEERTVGNQVQAFYKPGAPRTTFTQGHIKRYPSGPWKDVKGYRGPNDVERPHGEWNTLECVALDGKILVRLNDQTVNFALEAKPSKGRIGLQSNGAEIVFRNITLQPYNRHKGKHADEL